ncbi:uncharacterized protein TNCV_1561151 [Trichonephila clavipes]|nr:uncharacterized protein TNCV_1561151 [Trichonephila clavipes]
MYKDTLASSPRCSGRRRIDEADIRTPAALDQCALNCLEEAVHAVKDIRAGVDRRGADVTFRHPLPVLRVVRCSSIHCFQIRNAMELFRCQRDAIVR